MGDQDRELAEATFQAGRDEEAGEIILWLRAWADREDTIDACTAETLRRVARGIEDDEYRIERKVEAVKITTPLVGLRDTIDAELRRREQKPSIDYAATRLAAQGGCDVVVMRDGEIRMTDETQNMLTHIVLEKFHEKLHEAEDIIRCMLPCVSDPIVAKQAREWLVTNGMRDEAVGPK